MKDCIQKYKFFNFSTIFFLLLLCIGQPIFGNDNLPPIPDSLDKKIERAASDTARLRLMLEKCVWIREYRQDIMVEEYKRGWEYAVKLNDSLWIGKFESGLGVAYSFRLDYEKSLEHYHKALNLFEKIHNKREIAGVLHNIAIVLDRNKSHEEALVFLKKAEAINLSIQNKVWLQKNYGELGGIYKDMQKDDSAVFYYEKAVQLAEEIKSSSAILIAKSNLGNLYIKLKEFEKSEPLLRDAYRLAQSSNPQRRSHAAMVLADLLQCKGKFDEAEKYIQEAIKIKEESHQIHLLDYCYDIYSELEEKRGNYAQALKHYKRYRTLRDSTLSEEKQKALREFEVKYETEIKEKENLLLKKNNEIQQQQIYALLVLIGLLGIFIVYYYYSNQQKKKANALISKQKQDLFLQNEQLAAILAEKNNIIATVSHDYRSPLGRIRAISDILLLHPQNLTQNQQRHIQKIPQILQEATHLIDDLLDVSRLEKLSEGLIPCLLSPEEELKAIVQNYQNWIDKKELTIEWRFPSTNCNIWIDKAAFHRIFDNLLSNAIKYTFPQTSLFIHLEQHNQSSLIRIQDEGPGFTEKDKTLIFHPFQRLSARPIEVGTSYGLGLSIIKKLTEAVNATIHLENSPKGACFVWEIASLDSTKST